MCNICGARSMREVNVGHSVRMGRSWKTMAIMVLCASCLVGVVRGEGSMANPVSRALGCYTEGPEHLTSEACKAAKEVSGTFPFYNWMEICSTDFVPDGALCSAGRHEYRGLDLPRNDWAATTLSSGVPFTFLYNATNTQQGSIEFNITGDGYDPTQELKRANFDPAFLTRTGVTLKTGLNEISGVTPSGKTGRHLIYVVWRPSNDPYVFYSCCDVEFVDAPSPVPLPLDGSEQHGHNLLFPF